MISGILLFLTGVGSAAFFAMGLLILLVLVLDWEHPYDYDIPETDSGNTRL